MPHQFGDLFNPPGLTNCLGSAQVALDLTAVRSIAFPPLAQGEGSAEPLSSRGDLIGVLFVDGEYFTARRVPVEFIWRPDWIDRRCSWRELELSSRTIVPPHRKAVAVRLQIRNRGQSRRRVEIRFVIQGGATRKDKPWSWITPGEPDNRAEVVEGKSAVVFRSAHSGANSAVAASPAPSTITASALTYKLSIAPGESASLVFADALDNTAENALESALAVAHGFEAEAESATREWNSVLKAAFTPGNRVFSGYLPTLHTSDPAVARVYQAALSTLLFHRRDTPASVYGLTYITLSPRYWLTATFLWDISLSSLMLALLDPAVLRRNIETWMMVDIHKHFGTDLLTGEGIGPWYSVNDFAMCRMARDYVRWTGDRAWLDSVVGGKRVMERLVEYATWWHKLDTNGHGLADYGGVNNLLEAVSSYVHEVAGLNAANVFCMRFVADLLDSRGDSSRAAALRADARKLAGRVLDLYAQGTGAFNCRLPDGRMQLVRHCYDFATVLSTIPADIGEAQKREMIAYFQRELQTPNWMRALSASDSDVIFSVRPDHQWTGAYAAWPAICLNALYAAGEDKRALDWMRGIARSTMQGPVGQAHFAETAFPPEAGGGARKAPSDMPWINDWACVGGGAFLEPVVEGLFGVHAPLQGSLSASPRFADFDPHAELRGLNYQGKRYRVSARGPVAES